MLSPYKIQSNNPNKRTEKVSNTNFNKNSHQELDVKRPEMTSNDLELIQTKTRANEKNKNIVKAGSVHKNIEINDQYSDEILHNTNT